MPERVDVLLLIGDGHDVLGCGLGRSDTECGDSDGGTQGERGETTGEAESEAGESGGEVHGNAPCKFDGW